MNIEDVMTSGGLLVLHPDDNIGLAVQMLLWGGVRHLPVVRDLRVIGVLTVGEILLRQAEIGVPIAARESVETAMRAPAITARPEESLAAALARMLGRRIGCLPVVKDDVLVGMVTRTDLLRHQIEASLGLTTGEPRRIASIMTAAPVVVSASTTLIDAATLMASRRIRHLPVIGRDHGVVGIVSDRDLRAAVGDPLALLGNEPERARAQTRRVGEIMTTTPTTVRDTDPLPVVTERLLRDRVGAVLVVDADGKLVGIVSYVDLLRAVPASPARPMHRLDT